MPHSLGFFSPGMSMECMQKKGRRVHDQIGLGNVVLKLNRYLYHMFAQISHINTDVHCDSTRWGSAVFPKLT